MNAPANLDEFDGDLEELFAELTAAGLKQQFTVTADYNRATDQISVKVSLQPLVSSVSHFEDIDMVECEPARMRVVLDAKDGDPTMTELIDDLAENYQDGVPHEHVVAEALRYGWTKQEIEDRIDTLRKQGEIYSPQKGTYRRV